MLASLTEDRTLSRKTIRLLMLPIQLGQTQQTEKKMKAVWCKNYGYYNLFIVVFLVGSAIQDMNEPRTKGS